MLCGCGAVCDAACGACSQRRSNSSSPSRRASPVRGLTDVPAALKEDTTGDGCSDGGSGTPERSRDTVAAKRSPTKSCPRSPARSTLGQDLMSPKGPATAQAVPQPVPAAMDVSALGGAGWETIPAGGKGRRNGTAAPRKAVPMPEPRGGSPEPPSRRNSLGSCPRPVTQPGVTSGAASRQQVGAVRAVPVTAGLHAHAAAARAGPGGPTADQKGAGDLPAVRALPVTPKAVPVKAAPVLSSADPVLAQHLVSFIASSLVLYSAWFTVKMALCSVREGASRLCTGHLRDEVIRLNICACLAGCATCQPLAISGWQLGLHPWKNAWATSACSPCFQRGLAQAQPPGRGPSSTSRPVMHIGKLQVPCWQS